ncbi:hypothetical protein CO731_03617 [Aminobacter sp. MSH1]|uniref:hypothetical protein n=1 Tax=Aminobacter sp. MSH1 TaxID=374606 RepID=UPI000D504F5D|nr:hypothetical protein [Aminobacter sp. MSH1]AWC24137.1 hypothetical protein CO731_03617 [Aminobacter sp. MSH1]
MAVLAGIFGACRLLPYFAHNRATWVADYGSGQYLRLAVMAGWFRESPNLVLERA